MKRSLCLAVLAVSAVGCKPNPADLVPGEYTGPNNATVTVTKEKTYSSAIALPMVSITTTGKWSISGQSVTMTPETINGKPMDAAIKELGDGARKMGIGAAADKFLKELAKAQTFTMSEDGKTLTAGSTVLTKNGA